MKKIALLFAVAPLTTAADHNLQLSGLSIQELSSFKFADLASDQQTTTMTVISDEDLRRMGARTIWDALRTVPGFTVHTNTQANQPILVARGVGSSFSSPHVALFINGIALESRHSITITSIVDIPIATIERIEVVRGSSSTLFGASATMGAINIITKSAYSRNSELSASIGSYDTLEGYAQHTGSWEDKDWSITGYGVSTEGFEGKINRDSATYIAETTRTINSSVAPDHTNNGHKISMLSGNIKGQNWKAGIAARQFSHYETGTGIGQALDPDGLFRFHIVNGNAEHTTAFGSDYQLKTSLSTSYISQKTERDIVIYPAGVLSFEKDGNVIEPYPNGLLGNPEFKELTLNVKFDLEVYRFNNHLMRLGLGGTYDDLFYTSDVNNFNADLSPRGQMVNVSDTDEVYLPENTLKYVYGYVQDEWNLKNDLQLSWGARIDNFNGNLESAVSPRVALVWATTDRMVNKFAYSVGFRIPTSSERFSKNNPVRLGNPEIEAENSHTLEWSVNYQPSFCFDYKMTAYRFFIDNYIEYKLVEGSGAYRAQNSANVTGQGVEWELAYKMDNITMDVGWTMQSTKNGRGEHVTEYPAEAGYVQLSYALSPLLAVTSRLSHEHYNHRVAGDKRQSLKNNTTMDIIVNKDFDNGLAVDFSIYNVFDQIVRHPSPAPGFALPEDIPVSDRNVRLSLSYRFK